LTPEDASGTFLLLGAGFGIATFVLLIEITAWIIKTIHRKLILKGNVNSDSAVSRKSGDTRHNSMSNEQHETLVRGYRDQPGIRKRHAYSAGARFKTCDLDESPDDMLQYFISLHSMASLPVTNSPRMKNRRTQTPIPDYTFTLEGQGAISGDEIPEDARYDGYRKCEEAISKGSTSQTGNLGDQYFGDKVQESDNMSENDDTSSFVCFMKNQDPTEQDV
jgi:hypothetical protein